MRDAYLGELQWHCIITPPPHHATHMSSHKSRSVRPWALCFFFSLQRWACHNRIECFRGPWSFEGPPPLSTSLCLDKVGEFGARPLELRCRLESLFGWWVGGMWDDVHVCNPPPSPPPIKKKLKSTQFVIMQTQQLGGPWGPLPPSLFGSNKEGCRLFTTAIVTAWRAYKAAPVTAGCKQRFHGPWWARARVQSNPQRKF